jgi:EmrB/QacA subfamily drug resistance transporter
MKRALAVASFGAFVAALSTSLVAVSAPVIANDLHVTKGDVNWILTGYLLALSCLLALAGKAADVLGRKRVYLSGYGLFIVGSLLCAGAPVLRALIGARVLQGCGAAMLMAVGPAIVTRAAPPAQRARALGVQLALTYVGLTIGPSIGGFLSGHLGWQAVFLVIAGAGTIGALFAAAILEGEEPGQLSQWRTLDLIGAAGFALSLAALLIALHRVRNEGWASRSVLGTFALGLVAAIAFVRHEARVEHPVLPLGLFAQKPFTFGVIGSLVLYTVTFMLSAWLLPFHLQRAGLTPSEAGAYLTAQPLTMAIIAPMSGWIADRYGPRLPSTAGMVSIATGMFLVSRNVETRGAPLVLALGLIGLGAGLYVAPNSALIMGSAPRDRLATAGATAATARNLGMTLGVALGASLDRAFGFVTALVVASALAGAGAVLGLVRPSVIKSGP